MRRIKDWSNTVLDARICLWYRFRRDVKEDQSRAERVRFQMFSGQRTEDLNTQRVEVNHGLDLEQ